MIVDDQGPEVHDGVYQGGQFVVLEVGDDGTIGAWQRANDHWIDIVPWSPSGEVHPGTTPNDLEVRSEGSQLTFVVNSAHVAQFTTDLPPGRVGVFVGGDGNQVALERLRAQWPSEAGASAASPMNTPVPVSPAKPTPVPTPSADKLLVPSTVAAPTRTPIPMIQADVLTYASSVSRSELPNNIPYRVADTNHVGQEWEVKVEAPRADSPARAMGVITKIADEVLSNPAGPRVVSIWLYSQDPIKMAKDPFTADPDLAEAFTSRDGKGQNGDGVWPAGKYYGMFTPFGNRPFEDDGRIYVAIPVFTTRDKRDGPTSMDLYAIEQPPSR